MIAIHCVASVAVDSICSSVAPLFHANWLHLIVNIWAFLSVVFIYETPITRIAFAYITSVLCSVIISSNFPTIGFSGVVFFLFGSISFEVRRKAYYQLCMLLTLILGFMFPYIAAKLHLTAYAAGIAYALLNTPVNRLPIYPFKRK